MAAEYQAIARKTQGRARTEAKILAISLAIVIFFTMWTGLSRQHFEHMVQERGPIPKVKGLPARNVPDLTPPFGLALAEIFRPDAKRKKM